MWVASAVNKIKKIQNLTGLGLLLLLHQSWWKKRFPVAWPLCGPEICHQTSHQWESSAGRFGLCKLNQKLRKPARQVKAHGLGSGGSSHRRMSNSLRSSASRERSRSSRRSSSSTSCSSSSVSDSGSGNSSGSETRSSSSTSDRRRSRRRSRTVGGWVEKSVVAVLVKIKIVLANIQS